MPGTRLRRDRQRVRELPQAEALNRISGNEGITRLQLWKAREVPIGGPELRNSVMKAEGCDAGVVYLGTGHLAGSKKPPEHLPVAGGLTQQ